MPGSPILHHSGGVTGSCHRLISLAGGVISVLTARSVESMAILMVQLQVRG